MRICKYCNKRYPESEFGVALTIKNKVYRRHKCKSCYRIAKKELRQKYRRWIADYKRKQKCSKCGIADPRVLDFHHDNDNDKKFSVGAALTEGQGFNRIKKEIKKCVVVCANCHRILHSEKNSRDVI
ncbi:MAG: hypothetical protein Athens101410_132 [Parcubacteria group bacterium Athens1014_10]|nr:MAG: hypothetical protein Athens101410_132 [Parcubacteria group bacterium Athens1014_10]TSD05899.1 MAG: hypothetical protein Athens071412_181 [Parcubacteria group bacterium Athens0714_12]